MSDAASIALLFPGQGAQHVGMGADLCAKWAPAAGFFEQAEAITGLPIRKLCLEGPEEDLSRTDVAQPAIFTLSAALLAAREALLPPEKLAAEKPAFLAGLSLGEYTALYAAGSMDFQSGLKLVARRGQLMQEAAVATPSGMVAVMGLDEAKATELCRAAADGEALSCANFNAPGQIVLSGAAAACKRAEAMAKDFGASAAVPLKVAGAFHSAIMAPAAEKFAAALDAVAFADPRTPVISNVDAAPYASAGQIKGKLLAQLTSPVRWQQSVESLSARGVRRCLEIGPGKVLMGLLRRIDRNVTCTCVNSLDAVEKLTRGPAPA